VIIEGSHRIEGVSAEVVFDALADPAVLARTLPGCRTLTERGEGVYEVAIDVGVASVRGSYSGRVEIRERHRPDLYEATLEAGGVPGKVSAAMRAELADGADGAEIAYWMDARIAGRIAGVGQRVLAGVSRRNASAFFTALEQELTLGNAAPAGPPPAVPGPNAGLLERRRPRARAFAVALALALALLLIGRRRRARR
jgi:carbon monoxide dehydrogenase subunit G